MMLPSSTIEPPLKPQARRRFVVALGLQAIQDPGHDASADLVQQRPDLRLKLRHFLGHRFVLEELINQANATGEGARQLPHQGL
jgi:hypothetical protein